MLQRFADDLRHVFGRLDAIGRDVDAADQHVLAFEERDEIDRHARVGALERHLVDRGLGEQREDLLVLAPLVAEGLLPDDVRLDAVAVTDVHRGLRGHAFARALERGHAPLAHLVEVDVERGLVELDHVDADRGELARFLVQDLGEGERELLPRAVVLVE